MTSPDPLGEDDPEVQVKAYPGPGYRFTHAAFATYYRRYIWTIERVTSLIHRATLSGGRITLDDMLPAAVRFITTLERLHWLDPAEHALNVGFAAASAVDQWEYIAKGKPLGFDRSGRFIGELDPDEARQFTTRPDVRAERVEVTYVKSVKPDDLNKPPTHFQIFPPTTNTDALLGEVVEWMRNNGYYYPVEKGGDKGGSQEGQL